MNNECRHFQSRCLGHCQVFEYPRLVPECARVQVSHDQRHRVCGLTTDHSPGDTGGQLGGRVLVTRGHQTLTVTTDVLGQLCPPSELVTTLMTLIRSDSRVSHLVLVQVSLVGELFAAELAREAEHLGVYRLFVLLDVLGIGRHVPADVTDSVRSLLYNRNRLIVHIDPMNVQFV